MPRIPTVAAAANERLFGRPVTVTAAQRPSDGIAVVTLTGDVFASAKAKPGAEVEFRVAPNELRHYTLATVDPDARTASLILCTRGDGPGRTWARGLVAGAELTLLGPGKCPVPEQPATLVLGDVTALALATALGAHTGTDGAVEVHPDDAGAAAELLPGLRVLAATTPGTALLDWLNANPDTRPESGTHLAGHVQTLTALRTVLRGRGVPRRAISTHAYWADNKSGL